MEELVIKKPELIGRDEDLLKLKKSLENAFDGNGSTVFIAGEAGIGKTRLVSELKKIAEEKDVDIIQGWCLAESLEPLMPVKTALREAGLSNMISGDPPPKVISAYLINDAGKLISKAEREESDLDPDIFASMLQAVGNFVQESLQMMDKKGGAGLNSLGYGDYTILIQSSGRISIATVIEGMNSEFLIEDMKKTLEDIGDEFEDWSGAESETADAKRKIEWFIDSGKYDGRFLVDDSKIKQENLFDNILMGLQRKSKEAPLMIFLDDLQWADPSSLNLLHYLSRNTKKDRIIIVGTYRPEDIIESLEGKPHQLKTAVQNMSREDLFEQIELKRLDEKGTASLTIGALGETDLDDAFFERIFSETEGTPFFVLEVVKLLIEDKALRHNEDGFWELITEINELKIPSKVHDVIQRRLDRLMKDQRKILDCASVVGDGFESDIVGNVLGVNKLRLLEDLSEIEKTHQLIHSFQKKYTFDHAKVREVLYNGIMDELKQEYHKNIGDSLMDIYKDESDNIVDRLAYHYYEAGDERAGEYLVKAGDMAKERYANEESMRLYRNALKVLKDDEKLRHTYENLGDVNFLAGEFTTTIDNYDSALEMEPDNKKKMNIHKKIAGVYAKTGDFQKSKEVCDSGLELLKDEECRERAQLLESLGWAYIRMGDYEKASELLVKSLKIAENFRDKKEIAHAHHSIGTMSLTKGDFDEALKHLEKALEIREDIDDAIGQPASLNNIGIVHYNKGEMDKALEYYGQSLEINEKIGDKWGIATAFNNIGLVHSEKGEPDKALEYYEHCLEIEEKIGDKTGIASVLNNIGNLYHNKGEPDKALEYHGQSLEIREKIGDKTGIAHSLINIGNACHSKGETDKALEHLNKSHEIGMELGDKWILVHDYCGLAEAHFELGDVNMALENASKGLELSVKIGAKGEEGISYKVLGMIYRENAEWDRAITSFEKARAILEDIRDKNALARVFYEYGNMWNAKGEPDKAKANIEKALTMSQEIGLKLWEEKTRKALDEL